MARKKVSRFAWSGAALCFSLLAGLAVAPSLFRNKHFTVNLPVANDEVSASVFPLTHSLPLIVQNNNRLDKSGRSLQEIASGGDTLIVNFWATWCAPCVEELPALESLNRQLEARRKSGDLKTPRLVTVSVDEKTEDIFALFKTLNFVPTFIVLNDKDASFSRLVGTTKFPETYWVNSSGNRLFKWIGPQDWLSVDVLRKLASHSERPGSQIR